MRNGNGERIGRVFAGRCTTGEKHRDHHGDLRFARMACTDHGFLDVIGRIFCNRNARPRRHQQCKATRLTELQCGDRIARDKCLLNSDTIGGIGFNDQHEPRLDLDQTLGNTQPVVGCDGAIGDMGEARAGDVDDTPTGCPQARINAEKSY